MKKAILILLLFAAFVSGAQAQNRQKNTGKVPKALVAALNLTPDQQTKISSIMQTKKAQLDSLKVNTTLDKKTIGQRKKGVNMAAEKQMNDVLTPDQQKAYAEFKLDKKMNKQHQTGTSPMPPVTPPGN